MFLLGTNVGSLGHINVGSVFMRQSNTLSPALVDLHRRSKLLAEKQTEIKQDDNLEVPRDFR